MVSHDFIDLLFFGKLEVFMGAYLSGCNSSSVEYVITLVDIFSLGIIMIFVFWAVVGEPDGSLLHAI